MDFKGKRVLLRADLNVPVQDGKVTDATRIERMVPTIREIIKAGGKAILHQPFRPAQGQGRQGVSRWSRWCRRSSRRPGIRWASSIPTGSTCRRPGEAIDDAPDGSILVLENTRFHPGEEENDPALAKRMASLGDIYVNDAFSAAHRAHASTEGAGASAAVGGGARHAGRARGARSRARRAEEAGDRGSGRREGLDQARPAREPRQQGRRAGDRRRAWPTPSCLRAGLRHRQVARRTRHGRHR